MNTENHEDPAGDQPIEVEAELVNPAPEEENPSPSVKATGNRRLLMIVGAAAIAALVVVGVMLARRQIAKDPSVADSAPEATESAAPAPQTLELPSAGPAPPPAAPSTPPDKIFNSTTDAIKEGAASIGESFSSAPGSITELPPPPPEGGANDDLQKAAKDAAKAFAKPPNEIDLSDPQAALQSLEKVAAAAPDDRSSAIEQAAPEAPNASGAPHIATDNRAALEIARLEGSLAEQHQQAERQASEIVRLQSEIARLQAEGAPVLRRARTALLFAALADKAQSGMPYRREYDAFAAVGGDIAALAAYADQGLATEAALAADFELALLDALDVARRAGARGPLSKLSANLASLVHLRPAGPRNGDGGVAVLSRAEASVEKGDFAAAVETLAALDAVTRAPLNAWIARVRARVAADQAVAEARKGYASTASEPASL